VRCRIGNDTMTVQNDESVDITESKNYPAGMILFPLESNMSDELMSIVADVFTSRLPPTPVASPFCPRCEASLQASLDFRANYRDIDVSDRNFYTHCGLLIF
jgi:hypothetical protein